MKIIIIGGTGTLGRKIAARLEKTHEVVRVGSKSGDLQADISSPVSIEALFKASGPFDALINAAGYAHFGPLTSMTDADFRKGVNDKLMGQINLVLIGQHHIRPKGSFTLTSGILSEEPIPMGANLSAVNGAIEAFVRAAAIELEAGVRINVVNPSLVEDSPQFLPYYPGYTPVSMDQVVNAYEKSVLGARTGQVFKVW
jgi:NAD(P)-dependent dehydrogenase (short-subunit alcohol dehydrogenase family)